MEFWPFFKKKPKKSLLSSLKVDFHSHLIPGIDDGAKTMEETITMVKGLMELGIEKIITTPHIYSEYYPNSSEIILEGLEDVRTVLKEKSMDVTFNAAAEYFIDQHFESLLSEKKLLKVFGNFVLVEISFYQAPPNLENIIFNMRTKAYNPILAHPERYSFFNNNLNRYQRLKDLGCSFQVNLLSLSGYYGSAVQKTAELLLKNGMADYLSSDLHNIDQLEILEELAYSRTLLKWIEKYEFQNVSL